MQSLLFNIICNALRNEQNSRLRIVPIKLLCHPLDHISKFNLQRIEFFLMRIDHCISNALKYSGATYHSQMAANYQRAVSHLIIIKKTSLTVRRMERTRAHHSAHKRLCRRIAIIPGWSTFLASAAASGCATVLQVRKHVVSSIRVTFVCFYFCIFDERWIVIVTVVINSSLVGIKNFPPLTPIISWWQSLRLPTSHGDLISAKLRLIIGLQHYILPDLTKHVLIVNFNTFSLEQSFSWAQFGTSINYRHEN
jgi:hypothetical protein